MAVFPESPSVDDTVEMGDVTYKWNGAAWQVDVGEGGGSSEWTDTGTTIHPAETTDRVAIGTATADTSTGSIMTTDGAQSFKAITSPGDVAGYAKIYARSYTDASLMLHMNGTHDAEATTLTDSGRGAHTVRTPGTYNKPYYDTTDKKFTSALRFDTSTAGTNNGGDFCVVDWTSALSCPGAFTLDFWFRLAGSTPTGGSDSPLKSLFYAYDTTASNSNYTDIIALQYIRNTDETYNHHIVINLPNSNTYGSTFPFPASVTQSDLESGFHHFALVRDSLSSGAWRVYIDGIYRQYVAGANPNSYGTNATLSSSDYEVRIGRLRDTDGTNAENIQTGTRDFNGWIDELRFTNSADSTYIGTYTSSANFTLPTAPYAETTHILVRDSDGNETQLT